jgi:hypothetical protein
MFCFSKAMSWESTYSRFSMGEQMTMEILLKVHCSLDILSEAHGPV